MYRRPYVIMAVIGNNNTTFSRNKTVFDIYRPNCGRQMDAWFFEEVRDKYIKIIDQNQARRLWSTMHENTVLFIQTNFDKIMFSLHIPSKEYIFVRQVLRRRSVWEFAVFLAHSWDTGPKHKHHALSHATTLYGFLIETNYQYRRSDIWLWQIAFSTGNIKWSTPFGVWKCDSPGDR